MYFRWSISTLLLCLAAPLAAGDGDDASVSPVRGREIAQAAAEKNAANKVPTIPEAIDAATEKEVLAFVREHHPELVKLLSHLSESRPREYQKALRDLSRVRDRLTQIKRNNNERYELELAVWKAESRIQLLAARLHMGANDDLREQLRKALEEQMEFKVALLRHDRTVAQDRLDKLDTQIQRLEQERSQMIERQLQTITRMSDPAKAKYKPDKAADKTAKPGNKNK
jgi:hypothetical protein